MDRGKDSLLLPRALLLLGGVLMMIAGLALAAVGVPLFTVDHFIIAGFASVLGAACLGAIEWLEERNKRGR